MAALLVLARERRLSRLAFYFAFNLAVSGMKRRALIGLVINYSKLTDHS